jgi:hypothetical protein
VPERPRRQTPRAPLGTQLMLACIAVALGFGALLIPWVAVKSAVLALIAIAFLVAVVVRG